MLEEVLTPLVDKLQSSNDSEERLLVLDGLQQIMAVRSNVVLPMVIPHLIQPPINIKALSLLSSVAGHALYKHLPRVIPALATCIVQRKASINKSVSRFTSVSRFMFFSFLLSLIIGR